MILKKQNFKVSMYIQRIVSVFVWSSQTVENPQQGQIEIFFFGGISFLGLKLGHQEPPAKVLQKTGCPWLNWENLR